MRREIVAVDIGGTHARFAIAEVAAGRVLRLDPSETLATADHESFRHAWEAFGRRIGRLLPCAAAIAVAAPVSGETLKLTNNPWIIRPARLPHEIGIRDHLLINDFGAVGHAVAQCGPERFRHLCGPDIALPDPGVISVVGPGTGLGVAQLIRCDGRVAVVETEGGHLDFAPLDAIEDGVLGFLRARYGRVSAERIVSGPGLANLYEALGGGRVEDRRLWASALDGSDALAVAAFDRFRLSLGAFAGDIALAHGAAGVVIAGGLGLRIADRLPDSAFAARFTAKGRFARRMEAMPVKILVHPQPGLLGAAVAFAARFPA